jgi:hypothetical protein
LKPTKEDTPLLLQTVRRSVSWSALKLSAAVEAAEAAQIQQRKQRMSQTVTTQLTQQRSR